MFKAIYLQWLALFFFVSSTFSVFPPSPANAGVFSSFIALFSANSIHSSETINEDLNSQNIPLLQSSINFDLLAAKGGGDIITSGSEALMSENGPSGTLADIGNTVNNGQISRYTVRKGDTISGIALMFGVSVSTIVWANDINSSRSLREGQELVILPVSGTIHTIAKGDTLSNIAKKYKADAEEIAQYNNIDGKTLVVGETIVIPDGEGAALTSAITGVNPYRGGSGPTYAGYYIRPVTGGIRTQGIHGYNAVDIGVPTGTLVYASAAGEVIISRSSGWNGGYGKYIVVSHYNGTQTLYAHLSENLVTQGQKVYQGQTIGLSGSSGNSTGPHLHFEVRGAHNFMAD